jgi:hypothetical protein
VAAGEYDRAGDSLMVDNPDMMPAPAKAPEKGDQPMKGSRHRNSGLRKTLRVSAQDLAEMSALLVPELQTAHRTTLPAQPGS